MSDQVLTAAAIAIELGLPVLGLLLYWKLPLLRTKLIVILAALTPALFFYAWILIAYALDPADPGNGFAFFAGWMMTFFPYVTILVIAVGLSFLPKPTHLLGRYLLGLAPSAVVALYVMR